MESLQLGRDLRNVGVVNVREFVSRQVERLQRVGDRIQHALRMQHLDAVVGQIQMLQLRQMREGSRLDAQTDRRVADDEPLEARHPAKRRRRQLLNATTVNAEFFDVAERLEHARRQLHVDGARGGTQTTQRHTTRDRGGRRRTWKIEDGLNM